MGKMTKTKGMKKMKRLLWISGVCIIILSIFLTMTSMKSMGAESLASNSDSRTSFSIQAILPSNLEKENSNFFNLRMEPGQEQKIYVKVKNNTGEIIQIKTRVFTAFTNSDGFVDFQKKERKNGGLLPHIDELVSTEPILELEPYEVVSAVFHIKMPEEPYNGVVAGALNFSRVLETEEKEEKEAEAEKREVRDGAIKNIYSLMTGIFLHQGLEATPEIVVGDTKVELVNEKLEISTNFQNIKPAFAGTLNIQTQISCKKTKEVLFKDVREGMQMAPNSNFDYIVKVGAEYFQEENHIISYTLENNGAIWEFEKGITSDGEGIFWVKESIPRSNTRTLQEWMKSSFFRSAMLLLLGGGTIGMIKKMKRRKPSC